MRSLSESEKGNPERSVEGRMMIFTCFQRRHQMMWSNVKETNFSFDEKMMKPRSYFDYEENVSVIKGDYVLLVQTDSPDDDDAVRKVEIKDDVKDSEREEQLMQELEQQLEKTTQRNLQKPKTENQRARLIMEKVELKKIIGRHATLSHSFEAGTLEVVAITLELNCPTA